MTTLEPRTALIRPAQAGDEELIGPFLRRLSSDSLRSRFLGGLSRDAAEAELRYEVGSRPGCRAVVAEDPDGNVVGEAFAGAIDDETMELAFVVADDWQHHGIGNALIDALVGSLRASGTRRVVIETLWDNGAMIALMRHLALPLCEERVGCGVLRVSAALLP